MPIYQILLLSICFEYLGTKIMKRFSIFKFNAFNNAWRYFDNISNKLHLHDFVKDIYPPELTLNTDDVSSISAKCRVNA